MPFPGQNCFNFDLEMAGVANGDPGEAESTIHLTAGKIQIFTVERHASLADFAGKIDVTAARLLEQFTNEMSQLLCKDLSANPCRRMGAGELCSPLSDHLKRNML